jgi:hypothetical protein
MQRVRTRIGDVFSVSLDSGSKKYFQYIANDLTQLNSEVIRAFKKTYPINACPELIQVVSDDVDFYAHVVVKWGIKMSLWEKVGNAAYSEKPNVVFRDSKDYGKKVKTSHNWRVWKTNEKFQAVGELVGEHRKAEIGIVVAPADVVHRMRTGEYDFVYPGYLATQ